MKFEQPSKPTPEEIAKIEKERVLSDAELLNKGAEYKGGGEGNVRLEATEDQISTAKREKESDLTSKSRREEVEGKREVKTPEQLGIDIKYASPEMLRLGGPLYEYVKNQGETHLRDKWKSYALEELKKGRTADEIIKGENPKGRLSPKSTKEDMDQFAFILGNADYMTSDEQERVIGEAVMEAKNETKQTPGETAPSQSVESQVELEKGLYKVESFEDLTKLLEANGGIQGSQEFFSVTDLKNVINQVRKGELKSTAITRTGGLRQKVEDLLAIEKQRDTIQNS